LTGPIAKQPQFQPNKDRSLCLSHAPRRSHRHSFAFIASPAPYKIRPSQQPQDRGQVLGIRRRLICAIDTSPSRSTAAPIRTRTAPHYTETRPQRLLGNVSSRLLSSRPAAARLRRPGPLPAAISSASSGCVWWPAVWWPGASARLPAPGPYAIPGTAASAQERRWRRLPQGLSGRAMLLFRLRGGL